MGGGFGGLFFVCLFVGFVVFFNFKTHPSVYMHVNMFSN